MDAAVERQIKGELSYISSRRDKKQVRHLHAPQARIKWRQRFFQILCADQSNHHLHFDTRRLLTAVVEHRLPMKTFVGEQPDTEPFRNPHLGRKCVRVNPPQLVAVSLIYSLIAEECVTKI